MQIRPPFMVSYSITTFTMIDLAVIAIQVALMSRKASD